MKWFKRFKDSWGRKEQEEAQARAQQVPSPAQADSPEAQGDAPAAQADNTAPQSGTAPKLTLVRPPLTDAGRFRTLSPREREVFEGLLAGKKQREIAELLDVKLTTVSFHCTAMYKKLDIHDKAHLFLRYARFTGQGPDEEATRR